MTNLAHQLVPRDSGFKEEYDADDTGIVKTRMSGFLSCKIQVCKIILEVCVARYGPGSRLWCVFKAKLGVVTEFYTRIT